MGLSQTQPILQPAHSFAASPVSQVAPARPFDRLPLEVFLRVCTHNSWRDLIRASHVSRSWRKAIVGDVTLWKELNEFDLRREGELERVRVWTERARGGLVGLRLVSGRSTGTGSRTVQVHHTPDRLVGVLRSVAQKVGSSNLRHLTLDLCRTRGSDWCYIYEMIDHLGRFCQFGATHLDSLELRTNLPGLPGGGRWLELVPRLKRLTLTCEGDDIEWDELPEWIQSAEFGREGNPDGLDAIELEEWTLAGPSLVDYVFPAMPSLRRLSLHHSTVEDLYGLLCACSATLETLTLADVVARPPHLSVSHPLIDLPPEPIYMTALRSISLAGYSPTLWREPDEASAHLAIVAPVLEHVSFARTPAVQSWPGGRAPYHGAHQEVDAQVIQYLLDSSPGLASLDVSGTNLTMDALRFGLVGTDHGLGRLVLGEVADDVSLRSVLCLLPRLTSLHFGRTPSTFVALARTVAGLLEKATADLRDLTVRLVKPGAAGATARSVLPERDVQLGKDARLKASAITAKQLERLLPSVGGKVPVFPSAGRLGPATNADVLALAGCVLADDSKESGAALEQAREAVAKWMEVRAEQRALRWLEEQGWVTLVEEGE